MLDRVRDAAVHGQQTSVQANLVLNQGLVRRTSRNPTLLKRPYALPDPVKNLQDILFSFRRVTVVSGRVPVGSLRPRHRGRQGVEHGPVLAAGLALKCQHVATSSTR